MDKTFAWQKFAVLQKVRIGVDMSLGCNIPDDISGSIGVKRKKLSWLTRVISVLLPKRFCASRSTLLPAKPPPSIKILGLRDSLELNLRITCVTPKSLSF